MTKKYLVIGHPDCSTCKKALAWLNQHGIEYTWRNIIEDRPTAAELTQWIRESNLPMRRFFNTSGQAYRSLNLATELSEMSDEKALHLLASDGMLCKRPLVIDSEGHFVAVGFKPDEWTTKLCK
ncbi:arsenate reductase family protein [Alloscardovia venturai]|uniref:Arsenate reductase family protein n=1 Tax=Alloscardovia venturai TaxID=1769421 RepID=A0ABW2Y729_9BIFI